MKKRNCWEYMNCGMEPGGEKAEKMGVCPAARDTKHDGTNNGKFAGRFCWAVVGTLCEEAPSGIFDIKIMDCLNCSFFKEVNKEEDTDFTLTPDYKKQ